MKYKFLDKSGLQIVINQIKNLFIPKDRKIANIDLQDDISAEDLAANLNEYIVGKDGKSAYEVAIDQGFQGTEAEWLESLKGEAGTSILDTISLSDDDNGNVTLSWFEYEDGNEVEY